MLGFFHSPSTRSAPIGIHEHYSGGDSPLPVGLPDQFGIGALESGEFGGCQAGSLGAAAVGCVYDVAGALNLERPLAAVRLNGESQVVPFRTKPLSNAKEDDG